MYSEASHKVMDILRQYTPLLEQVSIDEAFLDLSDLPEPIEALAHQHPGRDPRRRWGCPARWARRRNKLVAKIATDAGKAACLRAGGAPHPPNAITVVPPGEEAAFLQPAARPGAVGRGTEDRRAAEGAGHPHHRRAGGLPRRGSWCGCSASTAPG